MSAAHAARLFVFKKNGPQRANLEGPRDLFLKSIEIFRVYFGCHNSVYTLAEVVSNPLSFSHINTMLKDQLLKVKGFIR